MLESVYASRLTRHVHLLISRLCDTTHAFPSLSLINISLLCLSSQSGVVNVYSSSDSLCAHPKPRKSIMNLTTTIHEMTFNHDSQLLAIASHKIKDAMRLVSHILPFPFGSCVHTLVSVLLSLCFGCHETDEPMSRLLLFVNAFPF